MQLAASALACAERGPRVDPCICEAVMMVMAAYSGGDDSGGGGGGGGDGSGGGENDVSIAPIRLIFHQFLDLCGAFPRI